MAEFLRHIPHLFGLVCFITGLVLGCIFNIVTDLEE